MSETKKIKKRYDRISGIYDYLQIGIDFFLSKWNRKLWEMVPAGTVLEVGVGTGKNIKFYNIDHVITAIDISEKMLNKAREKATQSGKKVEFKIADIQALSYDSQSFDSVVSTCVFCSVPDPAAGLKEIRRVLKPGGKLYMVEHVLSHHCLLRSVMLMLDFIPYHIVGAHINRDTITNIKNAGFTITTEDNLILDVFKLIKAELA